MTPDQKPPTYEELARTLDEFFDEWPWGFTTIEMASVLRSAYPKQLAGVHPLWDFIAAYVKNRLKSTGSNKLFSLPSWKELFYVFLVPRGGGDALPAWAKQQSRQSQNISFYGRKLEYS